MKKVKIAEVGMKLDLSKNLELPNYWYSLKHKSQEGDRIPCSEKLFNTFWTIWVQAYSSVGDYFIENYKVFVDYEGMNLLVEDSINSKHIKKL